MADTAVLVAAEQQQGGGQSRAQRLKQKRKDRKKSKKENVTADGNKKAKLNEGDTPSGVKVKQEPQSETSQQLPLGVEIEYVAPNPLDELEKDDPMYQEFAAIFARFSGASEDETTEDVEMADEPVEVKPDPAISASSAMSGDSDDEDGSKKGSKLSKKKQRQLRRLNIAALKQIVKRPDLVEIHDCSAPDPLLAIHMKGYRNSVGIPRHWAQRRKYLQVCIFPSLVRIF
jgi:splicing factor 3B subunit 2